MEDVSIKDLVVFTKKRACILALSIVIVIGISAFLAFVVFETEYKTYSTLMVGKPQDLNVGFEYSDLLLNQKLVTTYRELVKSKVIANEVIQNLKINMTYESWREKINVVLVEDTGIIRIEVNYSDPIYASKIANELSIVFIKNIKEIMKMDNIQVIEEAEIPLYPYKPKKTLILIIGGLLGVIIGITIITLIEFFDNTLKDSDDIKKNLKLPVLGAIYKSNKKDPIMLFESYQDQARNMRFSLSEAYRILSTYIQILAINKNIKVILVTSPGPGEGKSIIASNLACTMSNSNKKILLIDCNLRKPSIHKLFGIDNEKGFTSFFRDDINFHEIINRIYRGNLDILTAGPILPDSQEILSSNRMKIFLEQVKKNYDIILIDSPPIALFADAVILSTIVDAEIVVCASEHTNIAEAQKASELLTNVNANILGVVLNKVYLNRFSNQRYYSHYNYSID